jgi:Tol biopolymer transport system component
MPTRLLIASLALSTLVLAPQTTPASAQTLAADSIVYESSSAGSTDIWIMNADGTGQTNLTADSPAEDIDPELSPDGTRIVFSSNRLTDQNPDVNYELFAMNVDGSDVTQLTFSDNSAPGAFVQSLDPTWSPDGATVAFTGYRSAQSSWAEIVTVPADASGVETMLTDPTNFENKSQPDWSPDGSLIVFTSYFDEFTQDLHTVAPDGTGEVNLTPDSSAAERDPAWDPTGTRLAFLTGRFCCGVFPNPNTEIAVMEYPSLAFTRVTEDEHRDEEPSWSPDGTKIAFSSDRNVTFDIYEVDAPPVAPPAAARTAAPTDDGAVLLNGAGGDQQDPYWGAGAATGSLVKVAVVGQGSVRSTPTGIKCGTTSGDCSETFASGVRVTFTARPAPGYEIARWKGCVSVTKTAPTCSITVSSPTQVTVKFVPAS